jgi:hypothetical protein
MRPLRSPGETPVVEQFVTFVAGDAGEVLTLQRAAYVTEARAHGDLNLPPLRQSLSQLFQRDEECGCIILGDSMCTVGRRHSPGA